MSNSTDDVLSYKSYTEYIVSEKIWIYISPILIVVGTIANTLAIVVLLQKKLRSSTTMFYLTVLAFGDITVLCTGLLRFWLRYAFHINIRLYSVFGCKFHAFLVYFCLGFTTWILVAVTVDRCIFVCFPHKAKQLCTMVRARQTVFGIAAVLFIINSHLFWGVSLQVTLGEMACTGTNNFTELVWPWIDLCISSIFPFAVMIVCNTLIIRRVVRSNKRIAAMRGSDKRLNAPNTSNVKRIPSVTVMLLSVNFVFLILTLPIVTFLIVYNDIIATANAYTTASLLLCWAIVNMLQYTNNTIHFFLYCLTGPRFRRELFRLLGKKKLPNAESSDTLEMK